MTFGPSILADSKKHPIQERLDRRLRGVEQKLSSEIKNRFRDRFQQALALHAEHPLLVHTLEFPSFKDVIRGIDTFLLDEIKKALTRQRAEHIWLNSFPESDPRRRLESYLRSELSFSKNVKPPTPMPAPFEPIPVLTVAEPLFVPEQYEQYLTKLYPTLDFWFRPSHLVEYITTHNSIIDVEHVLEGLRHHQKPPKSLKPLFRSMCKRNAEETFMSHIQQYCHTIARHDFPPNTLSNTLWRYIIHIHFGHQIDSSLLSMFPRRRYFEQWLLQQELHTRHPIFDDPRTISQETLYDVLVRVAYHVSTHPM